MRPQIFDKFTFRTRQSTFPNVFSSLPVRSIRHKINRNPIRCNCRMRYCNRTILEESNHLRSRPLPSRSRRRIDFSIGICIIFLRCFGKIHGSAIRRKSTATQFSSSRKFLRKNSFRLTPFTSRIFFYKINITVRQIGYKIICNSFFYRHSVGCKIQLIRIKSLKSRTVSMPVPCVEIIISPHNITRRLSLPLRNHLCPVQSIQRKHSGTVMLQIDFVILNRFPIFGIPMLSLCQPEINDAVLIFRPDSTGIHHFGTGII
ncbi:MAG: hypothetical protein BWY67_02331 [Bacteroidetes bacterium ADurb.Bin397]|nr:MAG: hypothetical protein BWY67_02331 [Bacteroidetes bacterium ADurb.Bin397]